MAGGRFNHYWFDLNRDWLPAQHVESQNRLKWFHLWKPNILPTITSRKQCNILLSARCTIEGKPLTPARNQQLTEKIGTYHARFLDR
jgi:hypothetical protein